MNIARWWMEWIVEKQHHFPRKMSLLNLFDRTLFLFRVGTNPPEPLNSPNLDGEPLSSYAGNYPTFKIKMPERTFYKIFKITSENHRHSSHRDSHNPIQSRSGQILWIRGLTRLQTQVSQFSLLFLRPLIKKSAITHVSDTITVWQQGWIWSTLSRWGMRFKTIYSPWRCVTTDD